MLAATMIACGGSSEAADERVLELEAKAHSLEESVEALRDENARLRADLIALGQRHDHYHEEQEAAAAAKERELREESEYESGQEGQLASLEEGQARSELRLDDLDERVEELEAFAERFESLTEAKETWPSDKDGETP